MEETTRSSDLINGDRVPRRILPDNQHLGSRSDIKGLNACFTIQETDVSSQASDDSGICGADLTDAVPNFSLTTPSECRGLREAIGPKNDPMDPSELNGESGVLDQDQAGHGDQGETKCSPCLKQSGLLRFFESELFNMHYAVQYLAKCRESGILAYIGNRMFSFDDPHVSCYLPQLVCLYVHHSEVADAIKNYLIRR